MRSLRLLLLGLASVYPLYWTAQFCLFFLPEALFAFWLGRPLHVVSISYLQATAVAQPPSAMPAYWEALGFAVLFSLLVLGLRGDRFLTGGLAIVILGQSALLPFISAAGAAEQLGAGVTLGAGAAFGLVIFGLHRILRRVGGSGLLERLALLVLMAVLPQAALWVAFRLAYPFFGTRFLLMLLVPLYLGACVAAAMPASWPRPVFAAGGWGTAPWSEILASSAAAVLLIVAIALSTHFASELAASPQRDSLLLEPRHSATHAPTEPRSFLAASRRGMLF